MSRWATDPSKSDPSKEEALLAAEGPTLAPGGASVSRVRAPRWMRVAPFFLSAAFFLSALLAMLAPLPLLVLYFRGGRRWGWLAALTNAAIVFAVGGLASFAVYSGVVLSMALVLAELLNRRIKLERAAAITLLATLLAGSAWVAAFGLIEHVNPVRLFSEQVSLVVQQLDPSVTESLISVTDVEEFKRRVIIEFPSVIAWMLLGMVWLNSVILLRSNVGGIRERLGLAPGFLLRWKAPEWLVWPTILSGIFLILDAGVVSDVSINLFKFLMAIYVLQGLSILGFFFDVWNIRGPVRFAGFAIAVLLMMPLVLSLGFFDLWFDFRSKFRQS